MPSAKPKPLTAIPIATYQGPQNRNAVCRRPQCGYRTTVPSFAEARNRMAEHRKGKHRFPDTG